MNPHRSMMLPRGSDLFFLSLGSALKDKKSSIHELFRPLIDACHVLGNLEAWAVGGCSGQIDRLKHGVRLR
ncbi:hypothetical protein PSQ40_14450 [Curvibacter sp. HBC61]|uniref:Uncharacterized protein n=1 Tax=Curvibacter cyanobacteriorum TaxID=3026422 RepID=A0ABT5N3X7_9BURK|nr:hypothetical protein [Curvibacter sp. HBC61]MDD0839782.1 hypothetical protein [Curvibacter sp. HBC61]